MSEDHNKPEQGNPSVDEILAEFSSKPKVVQFPGAAPKPTSDVPDVSADRPEPGPEPLVLKDPEPAPELPEIQLDKLEEEPENTSRLSELVRRAERFADHMYDQAEPDDETLLVEKYTPGVDQEDEDGGEEPARPRRRRRPADLPPDTAPADLARRYQEGIKGRGVRLRLSAVVSILTILASLNFPLPGALAAMEPGKFFTLRSLILTILLCVVAALCWDVLMEGVQQALSLRPGPQLILVFAVLFTLLDGLSAGHLEARLTTLPCSAVTAMALTFQLWGFQCRRKADRITARTAGLVRSPYVVTLDEDKWNSKPAFTKWLGSAVGFGSELQQPDAVTKVYRFLSPLLILACLLCAFMASVGQKVPGRFLWSASVLFTVACPWSVLLAFGLPYKKLASRLNKVGAALAGWSAALRCKPGGIVITDGDFFAPGTVKVSQIKVFGGESTEKVIAYTATTLRAVNCGLTQPFHDLLRTQGAFYREVSGVRTHEGGFSSIIRNHDVLVGTASFMKLMKVLMPQGLNVKNSVFCAIDGHLAGMFLLDYRLNAEVNPAISALMHSGIHPIVATRDFNLIPDLLSQKFHLPVDKMEFPPIDRRMQLSQEEQEHDPQPVALLCREGLTAYSDAVVGGRRLCRATRLSLLFVLLGTVVGIALTFYLSALGAYASLTPVMLLIFMALWLVPELYLANWVNQY